MMRVRWTWVECRCCGDSVPYVDADYYLCGQCWKWTRRHRLRIRRP